MFEHHCTACEERRLMFQSQVTAIDVVDDGILVRFTCWCGAEQEALTGRHHREHAVAA